MLLDSKYKASSVTMNAMLCLLILPVASVREGASVQRSAMNQEAESTTDINLNLDTASGHRRYFNQHSAISLDALQHPIWSQEPLRKQPAVTGICCAITMLAIAGFIFLCWRTGEWETKDKQDIVYNYDNMKFLLIFCVVYGHLLLYIILGVASDSKTWLSNHSDAALKYLYIAGSIVVVPMFCFISGILSQAKASQGQFVTSQGQPVIGSSFIKFICFDLAPLLIWLFIKDVIITALSGAGPQEIWLALKATLYLVPKMDVRSYEWFWVMLCVWRASCFLVWTHLSPLAGMTISLTISCVAGYTSLGYADNFLALLPYLVAGYVLPSSKVLGLAEKTSCRARLLVAAAVLLWIFVGQEMTFLEPLPDGYGSYATGRSRIAFENAASIHFYLFWTRKVAKFALDIAVLIAFLFFVIPRKATAVSWIGRYSLFPYLLHPVGLIWRERLVAAFPPPVVTSSWGHSLVYAALALYALAITALFASAPCRWLFGWCIKPPIDRFVPLWFKEALGLQESETKAVDRREQSV